MLAQFDCLIGCSECANFFVKCPTEHLAENWEKSYNVVVSWVKACAGIQATL